MLLEKKALSAADLEAQTALELPDREMMALVNVVAFDVVDVNNNTVQANVSANVCGVGVIAEVDNTRCENTATNNAPGLNR